MFNEIPLIEEFIKENYKDIFTVYRKENEFCHISLGTAYTYQDALNIKETNNITTQTELFNEKKDNINIEENIDKFPYIEKDEINYLKEFKELLNDYIKRKKIHNEIPTSI